MKEIRIGSYSLPAKRVLIFAAALALWALGLATKKVTDRSPWLVTFFVASWLLAGYPVLKTAAKNLLSRRLMDENFLMSIATIGAFAIGEWAEGAAVMIFYMIGELIQEAAVNKSRSSIEALLALKPDKARVEDGDGWKELQSGEVNPGSMILVRPGERIPLDGIVLEGESSIDASMLTGESQPEACAPGSEVFSGTVSLNGVLRIKTTKSAGESSAARIVQLVQSAQEAKAKPERFITAFARRYTPAVVGAAVLLAVLPPLFVPDAVFSDWFYRALVLLVISCPCALVVSVPLGYFAGIGGLSRRGIMVKGALHLDSLNRAKNIAFDKTGTLTKGEFSVLALKPAEGVSEELLLETALLAEKESNHPIAKAITEYGKHHTPRPELSTSHTPMIHEIAGQGLELDLGGVKILAGNLKLLESRSIKIDSSSLDKAEGIYTPVYFARDGAYLGRFLVGDALKEGAAGAVKKLTRMGMRISMLTGDTRASAMEAASLLGIQDVQAELLPEDKLREVEKLASLGTTVFIGDGINDAPVLARAHVGVAMGSGADVAVEAADVIISTSDPGRIPELIERARKTRRIIIGNVVFALGAKGFFIILAAMGLANMWVALFADVGVALIAILNSSRALGGKDHSG